MTTIYPLYDTYGNYLDGYYTKNYDGLIEYLLATYNPEGQKINLGITDGVTIINNLKGDFSGYNCAIVEREDGTRDLYKITNKQFIRKNIWNITLVLDVFSKYYYETTNSSVVVNRLGIDRTEFTPILFNGEDFSLSEVKTRQENIVGISDIDGSELNHLYGYIMIWNNNSFSNITWTQSAATSPDFTVLDTTSDISTYMTGIYYDEKNIGFDSTTPQLFAIPYYRKYGKSTTTNAATCTVGFWGMNKGHITETDVMSTSYYEFPYNVGTNAESRIPISSLSKHEITFDGGAGTSGNSIYAKNMVDAFFEGNAISPWNSTSTTDREDTELEEMSYSTLNNGLIQFFAQQVNQNATLIDDVDKYENAIIKDTSTNTYYRLNKRDESIDSDINLTKNKISELTDCIGYSGSLNNTMTGSSVYPILHTYCNLTTYSRTLVGQDTPAVNITLNHEENTIDQPYTVIYIPCGLTNGWYDEDNYCSWNDKLVLDFINYCIENYSGDNGKLLDVQLCSMDIMKLHRNITNNTEFNFALENDAITSTQNIYGNNRSGFTLFRVNECDGLDYNYSIKKEVEDYKLEEQKKYILKSPSGTSSYDFSIAKNKGLDGFKLKWNIRPYGSMYQVQPLYNSEGLYGVNYTDSRGLVSLEDTSITMYSDLWETYKRQNINYLNSFNEGQDFERSQLALTQRQQWQSFGLQSGFEATAGAISAVGDTLGISSYGNSWGVNTNKAAGISGVGATAGTGIDILTNALTLRQQQRHQREQLQLKQRHDKQQWNYSLGNIKALPNNLNKVSGIYNTNTRFFYLETYEPTQLEVEAYTNYLDLFGVKVGYTLNLNNYTFNYIEGQAIKMSTPITNEEYEELETELESGRRLYNWEEEQ